jgi:exoribonuclease R
MKTLHDNDQHHRMLLQNLARRAMFERGLLSNFSTAALAELDKIQIAAVDTDDKSVHDLRELLWVSIDNDDSHDLDQLTAAEVLPGDSIRILVAVADVDSLVKNGSAIDEQARHNTTSVYTAAKVFPMLPEKLSTDLTSLNENEDRLAIVVDMNIGADGALQTSEITVSLPGWTGMELFLMRSLL